jgi:hypothetical protein
MAATNQVGSLFKLVSFVSHEDEQVKRKKTAIVFAHSLREQTLSIYYIPMPSILPLTGMSLLLGYWWA